MLNPEWSVDLANGDEWFDRYWQKNATVHPYLVQTWVRPGSELCVTAEKVSLASCDTIFARRGELALPGESAIFSTD